MNLTLWVLQVLLAVMFLWHGWLFVSPPAEAVTALDAAFPAGFRSFVGTAELLAALGLVLPGVTRVLPWLTPLAAAGLALVAGGASVFHALRGEVSSALFTVALCALTTFVAYSRWRLRPIPAR